MAMRMFRTSNRYKDSENDIAFKKYMANKQKSIRADTYEGDKYFSSLDRNAQLNKLLKMATQNKNIPRYRHSDLAPILKFDAFDVKIDPWDNDEAFYVSSYYFKVSKEDLEEIPLSLIIGMITSYNAKHKLCSHGNVIQFSKILYDYPVELYSTAFYVPVRELIYFDNRDSHNKSSFNKFF